MANSEKAKGGTYRFQRSAVRLIATGHYECQNFPKNMPVPQDELGEPCLVWYSPLVSPSATSRKLIETGHQVASLEGLSRCALVFSYSQSLCKASLGLGACSLNAGYFLYQACVTPEYSQGTTEAGRWQTCRKTHFPSYDHSLFSIWVWRHYQPPAAACLKFTVVFVLKSAHIVRCMVFPSKLKICSLGSCKRPWWEEGESILIIMKK